MRVLHNFCSSKMSKLPIAICTALLLCAGTVKSVPIGPADCRLDPAIQAQVDEQCNNLRAQNWQGEMPQCCSAGSSNKPAAIEPPPSAPSDEYLPQADYNQPNSTPPVDSDDCSSTPSPSPVDPPPPPAMETPKPDDGTAHLSSVPSDGSSSDFDFIQTLLDDHNHFRSLHVDTPPVSWDPNLAQLAQSWVNGCTGEHTPDATYGQNINTQWSYDGNVQQQRTFAGEATAGWYSEISNYNYNDPDPKWDASFGHFSAVVWRATDKVGCGMSLCPGEDVNFPYRIIVICNYGSSTPGYSLKENIMPLK